jgi:hypothetical protein
VVWNGSNRFDWSDFSLASAACTHWATPKICCSRKSAPSQMVSKLIFWRIQVTVSPSSGGAEHHKSEIMALSLRGRLDSAQGWRRGHHLQPGRKQGLNYELLAVSNIPQRTICSGRCGAVWMPLQNSRTEVTLQQGWLMFPRDSRSALSTSVKPPNEPPPEATLKLEKSH